MSTINLAGGNTLLSSGAFIPVRAASTGSALTPTTGGLLTVDGVTLAVFDRVLCKDETSAVDNGIYSVQTGPWVRTSDANSNQQFFAGMTVTAGPEGALNAGRTFVCTSTDDPVVVGTSNITFEDQRSVQDGQQMATSTTSQTIGTGSMTFATQSGKSFQTNEWVLVYETSNPDTNQLYGQVTSYSGTSLVVDVQYTEGSGTIADWTIVLASSPASAGRQPPVGTGNVTGPGSSTDGHLAAFSGTSGKVLKDGGTLGSLAALSSLTAQYLASSALGFATGMINGTLTASVASNAMTIAVKTLAGNDPSSSDPVYFLVTNGTGGYTVITQTSALSITVPSGATLGTQNAQTNRIWVGVFNNGGTAALGVYNSLNAASASAPSIKCWDETSAVTTTAISSGSTSPQLWYTGSALSSKNFRVIGFVESTQTTAGTWASAPSKTTLFGPGVKRPGETVQRLSTTFTTTPTTTSGTYAALSGISLAITPAAANLICARISGQFDLNGTGTGQLSLSRGTTNNTNMFGTESAMSEGGSLPASPFAVEGFDLPNGSATYALQAKTSGGLTLTLATNAAYSSTRTVMTLEEIQI